MKEKNKKWKGKGGRQKQIISLVQMALTTLIRHQNIDVLVIPYILDLAAFLMYDTWLQIMVALGQWLHIYIYVLPRACAPNVDDAPREMTFEVTDLQCDRQLKDRYSSNASLSDFFLSRFFRLWKSFSELLCTYRSTAVCQLLLSIMNTNTRLRYLKYQNTISDLLSQSVTLNNSE